MDELREPNGAATVAAVSVSEGFDPTYPVRRTTQAGRLHGASHFVRHLAEMTLAMMLGMALLGLAFRGALAGIGLDYDKVDLELPALSALVMAFNMSAPMAWWMRHRRHSWSYTTEMVAAMVVPVLVLILLYWLGVIASDALVGIQHAIMIPSMLVVMLHRRGELAG